MSSQTFIDFLRDLLGMNTYGVSLDKGKTWIKKIAQGTETNQIWEASSKDKGKTWKVYRKFTTDVVTPPPPPPTPTPVNIMGTVAVVNNSTNVTDATIKKWIDAVKIQADRDISKWWGYSVDFVQVAKGALIPKSDWYCGFFDNSDVAGAAGWHDVGPNDEPLIKCFTVNAGDPAITFSHEIAESISDTNANTTIKGFDESGRACTYFLENCDAVEAEIYQINGVNVSDFVTRNWFVANSKGPWDFLSHTSKPFQILQGGYMEVNYGQGWTEIDKFSQHLAKHHSNSSRYALYKKDEDARVKSTFQVGS
jgi:hypothetical protein